MMETGFHSFCFILEFQINSALASIKYFFRNTKKILIMPNFWTAVYIPQWHGRKKKKRFFEVYYEVPFQLSSSKVLIKNICALTLWGFVKTTIEM